MFSANIFQDKNYDFNIHLPKISYQISKMYEKYILKLYDNGQIKFITYLPNIKYKNANLKLKQNKEFKKYKLLRSDNLSIYNEYTFFDFINNSNEIITFIGNKIEDFVEQRNKSILFYIHKTILFCEDLIHFSPILAIYCSNLLQICDKLLHKYINKNNIDFSKYFIDLFEDLYNELTISIQNTIEIINSTFINYSPTMFEISLPKSKVLLKNTQKYELNEEERQNYKAKYYTYINTSKKIFYITNIFEFVNVCLYHFISNKTAIRKCNNCNCYFIAQRRDAIYCDFPSPQNSKLSCSKVRNHLNSRQKEQNLKIKWLYDNIESIFYNNKDKKEYQNFWENFKKIYKQKTEEIIYYRYTRKEMIEWLDSVKLDPLKLVQENYYTSDFNKEDLEQLLRDLNSFS